MGCKKRWSFPKDVFTSFLRSAVSQSSNRSSISFSGRLLTSGDFEGKTKILNAKTHRILATLDQGRPKILQNKFHP